MFARQMLRRFTTSAVRRSEHESGGIPGAVSNCIINLYYKIFNGNFYRRITGYFDNQ